MSKQIINPIDRISKKLKVPGDKSISHRALMIGALVDGTLEIDGFLESADTFSTIHCLRKLGVSIQKNLNTYVVTGKGLKSLQETDSILYCGNSGTTIRLLMGLLAGTGIRATLTGDLSLLKRPMDRVVAPLSKLGARFSLRENTFAPVEHLPHNALVGSPVVLDLPSAQVKSAVLLAGLNALGTTYLTGRIQSRDHTERLLSHLGADLKISSESISITGGTPLHGGKLQIPGDPSSAAYWLAAAAMLPKSEIEISDMLLNPTRLGFIRALENMGALISQEKYTETPEPFGDLRLKYNPLKGIFISKSETPFLIDEIPLLAVMATQAIGETVIEGAGELRFKESDRIGAVLENLTQMGADIRVQNDTLMIRGPVKLHGSTIQTYGDHRIAMAFSIAGLVARGETLIQDAECVGISYPNFFETFSELPK